MTQKDPNKPISTGLLGESVACKYLMSLGHEIVARNYRKPWGEVDVVTRQGNCLHFIEVKTVSRESNRGKDGIDPADNIHALKMKKFERAVESYLEENRVGVEEDWQIDAVLIILDRHGKKAEVTLLECVG